MIEVGAGPFDDRRLLAVLPVDSMDAAVSICKRISISVRQKNAAPWFESSGWMTGGDLLVHWAVATSIAHIKSSQSIDGDATRRRGPSHRNGP